MRLTKITDYAIVLLTYFARKTQPQTYSARDLAERAHISLPTVRKILKSLAHDGLLVSQRGTNGGYSLARAPGDISVADVVKVMEGTVAITECGEREGMCKYEPMCVIRGNWQAIHRRIQELLSGITLIELLQPLPYPVHQSESRDIREFITTPTSRTQTPPLRTVGTHIRPRDVGLQAPARSLEAQNAKARTERQSVGVRPAALRSTGSPRTKGPFEQ